MEIILSKQCESLTGSLGKGFGYHIQRRKNGFFAKRNGKGIVPTEGHLRFIFTCAELAQMGLHVSDIRVSAKELREALEEAGLFLSATHVVRHELSATDIINFHRYYLPDIA